MLSRPLEKLFKRRDEKGRNQEKERKTEKREKLELGGKTGERWEKQEKGNRSIGGKKGKD